MFIALLHYCHTVSKQTKIGRNKIKIWVSVPEISYILHHGSFNFLLLQPLPSKIEAAEAAGMDVSLPSGALPPHLQLAAGKKSHSLPVILQVLKSRFDAVFDIYSLVRCCNLTSQIRGALSLFFIIFHSIIIKTIK